MTRRDLRCGIALLAVASLVAGTPAARAQGAGFAITVTPGEVRPTEAVTVTGDVTDPTCPSVAYTVTLQYADASGDVATATASGTTDAAGHFTVDVIVPEDAAAGGPASMSASAECAGGARESEEDPVTILAWEGTLDITPDSGEPGTEVAVMGSNCYGGEAVVTFGSEGDADPDVVEGIALLPDRTFSGTYTVPGGTAPGRYLFAASCPGTAFAPVPFTVAAPTTTTTTVTTTASPTTSITQAVARTALPRTGTPLAPLATTATLVLAAGVLLVVRTRAFATDRPGHRRSAR